MLPPLNLQSSVAGYVYWFQGFVTAPAGGSAFSSPRAVIFLNAGFQFRDVAIPRNATPASVQSLTALGPESGRVRPSPPGLALAVPRHV